MRECSRLGENHAIPEYNTGDSRIYNGNLAVAVAITGTVATDGGAENENTDTIDGFSSSAPVIATATARLPAARSVLVVMRGSVDAWKPPYSRLYSVFDAAILGWSLFLVRPEQRELLRHVTASPTSSVCRSGHGSAERLL